MSMTLLEIQAQFADSAATKQRALDALAVPTLRAAVFAGQRQHPQPARLRRAHRLQDVA